MLVKIPDLVRRIHRRLTETWTLEGWDTFDGHSYPIGGRYFSQKAAKRAARRQLKRLERQQPTETSGGQDGIQDQVHIVSPDGSSFRYRKDDDDETTVYPWIDKRLAIGSFMTLEEVVDASFTQDGHTLSLMAVVAEGTSMEQAQELGHRFVRIVKDLGPGPSPQESIGAGIYDYRIRVVDTSMAPVAQGAKSREDSYIVW